MIDEIRVWIRTRKGKKRTVYDLRWLDPATNKVRSKSVGTDRKLAERERGVLEKQLTEGTFEDVRHIRWDVFIDAYVATIEHVGYATDVRQALKEFNDTMHPRSPRAVTFGTLKQYVVMLSRKGVKASTINKKLTRLRAALNEAIRCGHLAKNPMDKSLFRTVDRKAPRVLTEAEETALLKAAESRGYQWWALIHMLLATGARRGELTGLSWDRVHLDDDPRIHFTKTKTHRDRVVPLNTDAVLVLRRLQAMTLQKPGPFWGMHHEFDYHWPKIARKAGVEDATGHCLRKTAITKLVRAGVPLPTVSELCGVGVDLIMGVYNQVSADDKRAAIRKLERGAG